MGVAALDVMQDTEDKDIELVERSSLEIAERCLALIAVVARSKEQPWINDWVERFQIISYLSTAERDFYLSTEPDSQSVVNFSWRAEALVSLVWSLNGIADMPPLSDQYWILEDDFIAAAMKNPNSFRLSAAKRPSEEINKMEGFLYHQHWRVRDKQLGFNNGAKIPLEPGELPIDDLNPSVVYERRYGMTWVTGEGENWDEVPTDT